MADFNKEGSPRQGGGPGSLRQILRLSAAATNDNKVAGHVAEGVH